MCKNILALILITLSITPTVHAQSLPESEPPMPDGTVECFDYYTFHSVAMQLFNPAQTALPGIPVTFDVSLTNENPYPLIDGALYVKIFRERADEADTIVNGSHIIDSFYALEGIVLDAAQTKNQSFTWTPPAGIPGGKYYAAGYFVTAERFNMSGLSFTDDVVGVTGDFELVSDAAPFYFDKDQVLVNGEPHRFIAAASQWPGRDRITVSVPIRNDSTEDRIAQVTWDVFSWDTLREEQLVTTEETAELVPAGGEVVIEYVLEDVDESVYLVRPSLIYQNEVISQQHIRFAREGVKKPRINFPGVLAYPLTVGAENTLFSCFHNAGTDSVVNDTSLVLKLTDENGATIHTYAYEGDTTGAMMAVADTFTPDRDYGTFTLTTTLSHDGAVVEEVAITYDCAAINEVYCPAVVAEETTDSAGNLWLWYVALGAIVGVGILAVIFGLLLSARVKQQEEDDYYHNNPV